MSINPEIAGRIQGGRFVPGVSGNPAGKPPGARARATRLAEQLMSDDAEAVVRAVIDAAKGGDMTAAKIILDRIAPPCRGRRVRLNLPPIVGAGDVLRALAAVTDAMSYGVISVEEAQGAAAVLENHRKALETFDLERRIAAIEEKHKLQ